ncbi:Zn-ribbon domain-containing OB-fold protein [Polaromonas sp. UC242_47]|uniref:Zn-ribbon domain-containing OB-fold protein n=1 Tax=Polaromonas sp. UC242_47 TaxID=3374626 RepID=UPI003791F811
MTQEQTLSGASDGVQAMHQAALDAGRLLIQRCTDCSQHVYFPRESCPHCGSAALDWVAPTGLGTVYAVTTVRRKPEAGGDYNVSLVDLDEGVRLMSRVDNIPPLDLKIGQRVQARVHLTDGCGLVLFDPLPAALVGVAP